MTGPRGRPLDPTGGAATGAPDGRLVDVASDSAPGRPEQRPRTSTRTRLLLGALAFLAATALLVLVTFGPARDREVSNLGDDVFEFNANAMAQRIAEDGRPRIFADPATGDRPLVITHSGTNPETGWAAFSGLAPAPPDECIIEWIPDDGEFVACDGRTFPADGEGLDQFAVEVDGSIVVVDLNFAERDEPIIGVDDDEDDG